jgi:hypothetical protein
MIKQASRRLSGFVAGSVRRPVVRSSATARATEWYTSFIAKWRELGEPPTMPPSRKIPGFIDKLLRIIQVIEVPYNESSICDSALIADRQDTSLVALGVALVSPYSNPRYLQRSSLRLDLDSVPSDGCVPPHQRSGPNGDTAHRTYYSARPIPFQ